MERACATPIQRCSNLEATSVGTSGARKVPCLSQSALNQVKLCPLFSQATQVRCFLRTKRATLAQDGRHGCGKAAASCHGHGRRNVEPGAASNTWLFKCSLNPKTRAARARDTCIADTGVIGSLDPGLTSRDRSAKSNAAESSNNGLPLDHFVPGAFAHEDGFEQDESADVISSHDKFDVVILSNGPGEVAAWVRPVVAQLRKQFWGAHSDLRISVLLAPCSHASGKEQQLVASYSEVDRCLPPQDFFRFVALGLLPAGWRPWYSRGICLFLGGDQFNALLVGWRLHFKSLIYAEDAARWPGLADRYFLRSASLMSAVSSRYQHRCRVVGDLLLSAVDADQDADSATPAADSAPGTTPIVGLLPGSKAIKLQLGVPFMLATAQEISKRLHPSPVGFVLPLAPTVDLPSLQLFASRDSNPTIDESGWAAGTLQNPRASLLNLEEEEGRNLPAAVLVTEKLELKVEVWQKLPPYGLLRQCDMCVTTIGTNTSELGALSVPMVVVLPSQALKMFRGATGGVLGLLAALPGAIGSKVAERVNSSLLRQAGFLAWPNRWVGEEIVPEMVGEVEPSDVADVVVRHLQSRDLLRDMKEKLRDAHMSVVGAGRVNAAEVIASEVLQVLSSLAQK